MRKRTLRKKLFAPVVIDDGCSKSFSTKNAAPLMNRTLVALGWQFVSVSSMFFFQMAVMVILARLLPVEAFGLLGQAMIIIGAASVISEIGVAPALIQRKELSETHIRVGFTLSISAGFVLTAIVWVCAPLVAAFFGSPELTSMVRLLSLTFVVSGVGSVAGALMRRSLDFKKVFYADFTSKVLGYAGVGVTLGLLHYGAWALVWAALTQAVLKTLILLYLSEHKLRFSFAPIEARDLLNFGVGMSFAQITNYSARNGDYFVVGRYLGAIPLGLYTRAYQLMVLPISEFAAVVTNVLFSAYSEIQHENERLKQAYMKSLLVSAMALFPVISGIAIAAPEIIRGLFGPKWSDAIVPLQILCIGGPFRAIYNHGDALARAKGAVYAQSWRHLVYAISVIVCSSIGAKWGIEGVAIGVVISLLIMYTMMAQLSIKLLDSNWKEFILPQLPGVILSCAVTGIGLPLTLLLRILHLPDLITLTCTILTCGVSVVVTGLLLPDSWITGSRLSIVEQVRKTWNQRVILQQA